MCWWTSLNCPQMYTLLVAASCFMCFVFCYLFVCVLHVPLNNAERRSPVLQMAPKMFRKVFSGWLARTSQIQPIKVKFVLKKIRTVQPEVPVFAFLDVTFHHITLHRCSRDPRCKCCTWTRCFTHSNHQQNSRTRYWE